MKKKIYKILNIVSIAYVILWIVATFIGLVIAATLNRDLGFTIAVGTFVIGLLPAIIAQIVWGETDIELKYWKD